MAEKRVFKRHRRRYRIKFRNPGDSDWKSAFTSDVSVEGLFIARVQPPSILDLELELELEGETIFLRGRVVRSKSIPPSLRVVEKGDGFGIKLDRATIPERWYELQMRLEAESAPQD